MRTESGGKSKNCYILYHKMNDVLVSAIKTEILTKDLKTLCVIFKAIYCHEMKSKIPVYVFS